MGRRVHCFYTRIVDLGSECVKSQIWAQFGPARFSPKDKYWHARPDSRVILFALRAQFGPGSRLRAQIDDILAQAKMRREMIFWPGGQVQSRDVPNCTPFSFVNLIYNSVFCRTLSIFHSHWKCWNSKTKSPQYVNIMSERCSIRVCSGLLRGELQLTVLPEAHLQSNTFTWEMLQLHDRGSGNRFLGILANLLIQNQLYINYPKLYSYTYVLLSSQGNWSIFFFCTSFEKLD